LQAEVWEKDRSGWQKIFPADLSNGKLNTGCRFLRLPSNGAKMIKAQDTYADGRSKMASKTLRSRERIEFTLAWPTDQ
jgi:hypothetical protein